MKTFRNFFMGILIVALYIPQSANAQTLSEELAAIADVTVDINGSGDFSSVQQAINSVPDFNTETTVIFVKKGIYREKIILGYEKTNVILVGEDVDSTIITWDDYGDKMLVDGDPSVGGHTFSTYTFRADPEGFQAFNIDFNNPTTFGQGVAFHSNGDKQILYHCRITGNQDTYFDNFRTRRYFKDCYVDGTTDFIFGFGITLFDSCQIRGKGGPITASATPQHYKFGHVFKDCRITTAPSASNVPLGRPWFAYANTMFYECWMSDGISDRGWSSWSGREGTCIYLEYNNYGPGADTTERIIGEQLNPALADEYTIENIFKAISFPSDMGEEVDSTEFFSMRNRFAESGYTARADTVLYAGRDTFPDYPTDDWIPAINETIKAIFDKYEVPFNDSINLNANITQIKYQGGNTFELTPGVSDYVIELDPSTTEVPEFEVFTENPKSNVEIEYPESIPGLTTILVTAYDKSSYSKINVFNSVNNAYSNAWLDSVFIKNIKVEEFEPEVYEYDFQLPKGSSKYFGVKLYKQVDDASSRTYKPSSLPGELVIDVTAVDEVTSHQYVFNISVSTALNDLNWHNFMIYTSKGTVKISVTSEASKHVQLSVINLNGQVVAHNKFHISSGDNKLSVPVQLEKGIYLYRLTDGEHTLEGKLNL